MTRTHDFDGVISPVLTPFGDDGNPDATRFLAHAIWLLDDGCTGLAPFGTTGEANSLGLEERMGLLDALIDGGVDPKCLMPGTGLCALSDTVSVTRHAVERGCGGVMMLPLFERRALVQGDRGAPGGRKGVSYSNSSARWHSAAVTSANFKRQTP